MISLTTGWKAGVRFCGLAVALGALIVSLTGCRARNQDNAVDFGVSGPVTGDNAEYAHLWRQGFELALDEINSNDGVRGRKVELDWEDSQSDPKQSVNIAQRFVDDDRILAEMGDFSSPASIAASPVYQRGELVQYGFTNSHPDFTKGGDYMFSNTASQQVYARQLLEMAEGYGKRTSVLFVMHACVESSRSGRYRARRHFRRPCRSGTYGDEFPDLETSGYSAIAALPYLNETFQFQSKTPDGGAFERIFCFCYPAALSNGFVAGMIPGISIAARKLAQSIAAAFYLQEREKLYERVLHFNDLELTGEEYH